MDKRCDEGYGHGILWLATLPQPETHYVDTETLLIE